VSDQSVVSRLENGPNGLRIDQANEWAKALGHEIDVSIHPAGQRPEVLARLDASWASLDDDARGIIERFVRMAERQTG
jgi:hypothetical protein